MIRKFTIMSVIFSFLMAGCVSIGEYKIKHSEVQKIKIGKTSMKEVINRFGYPRTKSYHYGEEPVRFSYVYLRSNSLTGRTTVQALVVAFDKKNIVSNVYYNGSSM